MTEPFAAIILSAGLSSRMGAFKPLLRLGEKTALERSVAFFRRVGIEYLQVVLGHQAELLVPIVEKLGVAYTVNHRYQEGMFTSVQCAMRQLPEGIKAFFMLPVDMPLVREQTLQTIRQAWHASGKGILHPVFWGKRGHPPLVSTSYRQMILESSGDGGLKALLLPFSDDILEIEVPDEHCVLDMDRPQDYAYMQHRWEHYAIPSYRECEHLLAYHFSASGSVVEHSRQVARVAITLVDALERGGVCFDRELLQAAALLHDCCRDQDNHAMVGANALCQMGFGEVAALVESHMDIVPSPSCEPLPQEVLFLADKLVAGQQLVSLEQRFAPALGRFAGEPSVLAAVQRRMAAATCIRTKCESLIHRSLDEVLVSGGLKPLEG